jgi:hypothetical protein
MRSLVKEALAADEEIERTGESLRLAVEPYIAHHTMCCRDGSGRQRDMTNDGLGIRVLVMSVGVVDALIHQVPEPAIAQHMRIAPRQISTQRIDGNLQDQSWGLFCCRGKGPQCKYRRSGQQADPHLMQAVRCFFSGARFRRHSTGPANVFVASSSSAGG